MRMITNFIVFVLLLPMFFNFLEYGRIHFCEEMKKDAIFLLFGWAIYEVARFIFSINMIKDKKE